MFVSPAMVKAGADVAKSALTMPPEVKTTSYSDSGGISYTEAPTSPIMVVFECVFPILVLGCAFVLLSKRGRK